MPSIYVDSIWGGELTPGGGGNATYDAPASNANCVDNPTITVMDCCRNTVDIQLGVNCNSKMLAHIDFVTE